MAKALCKATSKHSIGKNLAKGGACLARIAPAELLVTGLPSPRCPEINSRHPKHPSLSYYKPRGNPFSSPAIRISSFPSRWLLGLPSAPEGASNTVQTWRPGFRQPAITERLFSLPSNFKVEISHQRGGCIYIITQALTSEKFSLGFCVYDS